MKLILMALLLSLSIATEAQVAMPITSPPTEKTLVGKGTWVQKSGEKKFKVITANDSVAHWMTRRYENDRTLDRLVRTQKECVHGYYWERTFYFENEHWDEVINYIKPKLSRL